MTGAVHASAVLALAGFVSTTTWLKAAIDAHANQFLRCHKVGEIMVITAHLTLTADAADLAAGLGGQLHLPGVEESVLLSSASIHRILCDSTITPIDPTTLLTLVTGGATGAGGCIGEPQWWRDRARTVLHVGRDLGTVTPRLRRALEARDEHCAFPGCRVPGPGRPDPRPPRPRTGARRRLGSWVSG